MMRILVGDVLSDALPDSGWGQFDLFSLEECEPILKRHFPLAKQIDLDHAERALILEHSPALDVVANPRPRALPHKYTRRKEARMRAAFKKAFGGKK